MNWGSIIWHQLGAALDLLDDVVRACPDDLWRDVVWDDPDGQAYGEFWFIVYHTLVWTDRYLSRAGREFKPPEPFIAGALPEEPYSKDDLRAYLQQCRRKAQVTLEALDDETAAQPYVFPWEGGGEMPFAELMLYTMRHAQEHAAQLSLHLGRKTGTAPDWVSRAREGVA
jgi:uncharacterized damage-inducible protein DinB